MVVVLGLRDVACGGGGIAIPGDVPLRGQGCPRHTTSLLPPHPLPILQPRAHGVRKHILHLTTKIVLIANQVIVRLALPELSLPPQHSIRFGKYPPAKPGALVCEPLKAARRGR